MIVQNTHGAMLLRSIVPIRGIVQTRWAGALAPSRKAARCVSGGEAAAPARFGFAETREARLTLTLLQKIHKRTFISPENVLYYGITMV